MNTQEHTSTVAAETNPHRIDLSIDPWGNVQAKFSCSAPVGAPCRLWCAEDCEYADEEHRERHELTDQGRCSRVEGWFDESPLELYDGEGAPLRSGPVLLSWDGDNYTWSYDPQAREVTDAEVEAAARVLFAREEPDMNDWRWSRPNPHTPDAPFEWHNYWLGAARAALEAAREVSRG